MTDSYIQQLLQSDTFINKYGPAKLVETHISWVLLAREFVFKIKKPLRYSFLDFSTIDKRKFYCHKELVLNQRLAPAMYLSVVPICEDKGEITIEEDKENVIDYAVKMKRMDETRQMNLLLEKNEVRPAHIDQLVVQLANFHQHADVVKVQPDISAMQDDFADMLKVESFLKAHVDEEKTAIIRKAVVFSKTFLAGHFKRMVERYEKGWVIDGHGDLYSQNIFLPKDSMPVIFDCIEFSDHFRQVDVLNELAFFCMDLEYYDRSDLADYLLEKYNQLNPCLLNEADCHIFRYFKLYRANVRAKVGALKAMQMEEGMALQKQLDFIEAYLSLMQKYMGLFSELSTYPSSIIL